MPPPWKRCTEPRPRFQFEVTSGTLSLSAVYNCGPTGAAQQADYYRDNADSKQFHIERGRIKAGVGRGRPTNAWEQAAILEARGVPARVIEIESLEELETLLGYGLRPIGIGIEMSRVTAQTRGHSFTGWHRITLLRRIRRTRNGKTIRGFLYTDPNFSPLGGYRPDPHKGHRFISRAELRYAYIQNAPRYAIVPRYKKGEQP